MNRPRLHIHLTVDGKFAVGNGRRHHGLSHGVPVHRDIGRVSLEAEGLGLRIHDFKDHAQLFSRKMA